MTIKAYVTVSTFVPTWIHISMAVIVIEIEWTLLSLWGETCVLHHPPKLDLTRSGWFSSHVIAVVLLSPSLLTPLGVWLQTAAQCRWGGQHLDSRPALLLGGHDEQSPSLCRSRFWSLCSSSLATSRENWWRKQRMMSWNPPGWPKLLMRMLMSCDTSLDPEKSTLFQRHEKLPKQHMFSGRVVKFGTPFCSMGIIIVMGFWFLCEVWVWKPWGSANGSFIFCCSSELRRCPRLRLN